MQPSRRRNGPRDNAAFRETVTRRISRFFNNVDELQTIEKTPETPVIVELEDVPISTALGLILQPLGLGFRVLEALVETGGGTWKSLTQRISRRKERGLGRASPMSLT